MMVPIKLYLIGESPGDAVKMQILIHWWNRVGECISNILPGNTGGWSFLAALGIAGIYGLMA